MGSPDLHDFAAASTQNLYARRSSALASLFVTLMHAHRLKNHNNTTFDFKNLKET
jgi:hypothetical protein